MPLPQPRCDQNEDSPPLPLPRCPYSTPTLFSQGRAVGLLGVQIAVGVLNLDDQHSFWGKAGVRSLQHLEAALIREGVQHVEQADHITAPSLTQ